METLSAGSVVPSLPVVPAKPNLSNGASSNPRSVIGGAGETNYRAILSDATAREIYVAEGARLDVAKQFGVSRQLVSMIKHGRRYAAATADLRKDGAA